MSEVPLHRALRVAGSLFETPQMRAASERERESEREKEREREKEIERAATGHSTQRVAVEGRTHRVQWYLAHKKHPTPYDPSVALRLESFGGPTEGGVPLYALHRKVQAKWGEHRGVRTWLTILRQLLLRADRINTGTDRSASKRC